MRSDRILQLVALLLGGLGPSCTALPQQLGADTSRIPSTISVLSSNDKAGQRTLKGKFLHITDIHPDPYYKTHSSTADEHSCHRGSGPAGYYGAETSDCDSPISLLNATFAWINETIRDEIDFIIWTGDSARHDNDERIPRSVKQVVSQNELVVQKFLEVFGKPDYMDDPDPTNDFTIPIVPTLGNNDILPHNIFEEGPNKWTKTYLDVWRQFIPEEQRHQFVRGGWFYVEVIPNKLAVFSLNTLYFFDSNSAVDGCASKSDPGYEHFEWLRVQLEVLRERGMKAMLMGHVPPARVDSKMSWDETCWQKYTLWQKQYRDVIVGNFYGHMNIDHFMLQDFKDIKKSFKKGYAPAEMDEPKAKHAADEGLSVMSATEYLIDLRDYFSKIPSISEKLRIWEDDDEADSSWLESVMGIFKGKNGREKHGKKPQNPLSKIGGEYGERYSLSFVQPSVIPNFFPTLRVFEYNITGLGDLKFDASTPPETASKLSEELFNARSGQVPILAGTRKPSFIDEFVEDPTLSSSTSGKDVDEEKKKKNRKKNKYKFKVPKAPSKSTPPGPAYSPQTLSLLGYTQYFANITHINNDFLNANAEREEDVGEAGWKEGKHSGKTKKGKPHPKKFKYKVEYDTFSDKIFGLKDLTVRSYIDLAKIIGDSEHATQRSEFDGDVEETVDVEVEVDASKNGGKKKKKEKKAKKKSNKVWHAFIKRAFVGTIDPEEIEERFLVWKSASSLEQNGTTPSVAGGSLEL